MGRTPLCWGDWKKWWVVCGTLLARLCWPVLIWEQIDWQMYLYRKRKALANGG
jgi:hypothetical protein